MKSGLPSLRVRSSLSKDGTAAFPISRLINVSVSDALSRPTRRCRYPVLVDQLCKKFLPIRYQYENPTVYHRVRKETYKIQGSRVSTLCIFNDNHQGPPLTFPQQHILDG